MSAICEQKDVTQVNNNTFARLGDLGLYRPTEWGLLIVAIFKSRLHVQQ